MLAVATPLLPVQQQHASLDWPQPQSMQLSAPLVDYVPLTLDVSIPCTALRDLTGGTVLSTVPAEAPRAGSKGLVARVEDRPGAGRTLSVVLRDTLLLSASIADITGNAPAGKAAPGPTAEGQGSTPPPTGANQPTDPTNTQPPSSTPPSGGPPLGGTPPNGAPPPGSTPPNGAPSLGSTPPNGAPPPGSTPPNGAPSLGGTPPSGTSAFGTPPPNGAAPLGNAPTSGAPTSGGPPPSSAVTPSGAPASKPPAGPNGGPGGAVPERAQDARCGALTVVSTGSSTTAELTGMTRADGSPMKTTVDADVRPQVVGVFTELDRGRMGDARLHAEIDARFSSSPSGWKLAAIIGAVSSALLALICLHRGDTRDGRRPRRVLPARWWRFTGLDAVVAGTLAAWHVFGANSSDDGYILTMARASKEAGYTANYYRWFQVAEAPFGWPYEVLAQMTRVSEAGLWMRLPALLAGFVCWLVLSREVLPRLGSGVRASPVARWTAALVFLSIWLPYNNGLRPEPLIALGALLTWCSMERAIATRRLLPAAVAVLIAAFSLAAGPTGLICVAALLAGSRPVLRTIIARATTDSGASRGAVFLRYIALVAPILAAGTLVLVVVFADQTFSTVLEATRVRQLVGPDMSWFEERTRWDSLLSVNPDGSLARRFGVLAMLLCLAVGIVATLRRGRIPATARGPVTRVLAVVFMALLLMMFTPTKWTHHFGVYGGLAAALAAITAVALIRVERSYLRTLFAAAVLFLLAVSFTGSNGWWYVSGYGVPWPDRAPTLGGIAVSTVFLAATALTLLTALFQYYRAGIEAPTAATARDADDRSDSIADDRGTGDNGRTGDSSHTSDDNRTGDEGRAGVSGPASDNGTDGDVAGPGSSDTSRILERANGGQIKSGGDVGRRSRPRRRVPAVAPLTVAAAAMVLFEVGSLAVAAVSQYPAYSVGLSNLRALTGDQCAMADDVLVETNTADSLLTPYSGTIADGLSAENTGFTPNGVGSLAPDPGPGQSSAPPSGSGPGGSGPSGPGPGGSGPGGSSGPGGTSPSGGAPNGTSPGASAPGGASPSGSGFGGGASPSGNAPNSASPSSSAPSGSAPGAGVSPGGTNGSPGSPGGSTGAPPSGPTAGPPGAPGASGPAVAGVNGSTVALPFGLAPERTPVLGSYSTGEPQRTQLTTQWYRMDLAAAQQNPAYRVLILTVAGRIESTAPDGSRMPGQRLRVEFARRAEDGTITALGDSTPPAVGGAPGWRNFPVALDRITAGTNAVRLVADVAEPDPMQWLAITPPRLPKLSSLNTVVGSADPVLADWHVGLAFPCQRPFDHRNGVAEMPIWRIQPDKLNAQVSETWQGDTGGGPLGWTGMLMRSRTVPAYLADDWTRDWGELQRLTRTVTAPPADITVRTETRWGLTNETPIKTS
ncbi:EmbC-like arabinotransferase in arabinogalactan biosynthesis [Nocardia fluminea]|uniref:EmbC-like arabinotransferase in arabinogalactan biosynthesis n=2 Tax=Nocardia fluminea TaxID=134984 RepID=A0A2N3VF05_9NOCA|nr:EmbC-like arabinotransferase in arabinogalactan biosynthesis [Nocardia fluminea]